ncbi:hypothetical protein ACLMJK_000263 [Lecanora helva]
MPPAIQATSLAQLINLADNPPKNLNDRVFPEDYRLVRDEANHADLSEKALNSHRAAPDNISVPRKPLPQELGSASQAPIRTSQSVIPNLQGHDDDKSGHTGFDAAPGPPPRKLLGPRAMHQRLRSADDAALQSAPSKQNIDLRRWSEQPVAKPKLPPRINATKKSNMHRAVQERGWKDRDGLVKADQQSESSSVPVEHYWQWEKSWETRRASEARSEMAEVIVQQEFQKALQSAQDNTLTLIRRYNGEQRNVAKIRDTDASVESHALSTTDATSGVTIDVLTSGYLESIGQSAHHEDLPPHKPRLFNPDTDGEGNVVFRRRLWFSKDAKRHKSLQTREGSESRLSGEVVRPSFERRQASLDSFSRSKTDSSANVAAASRGYYIESPWNGICAFSTGIAGRSFKCKYFSAPTEQGFGSGNFLASVSELRFNLPSSRAFGTPDAKVSTPGSPREAKRSSLFRRSHRESTSYFDTSMDNSNDALDAKVELQDRLDLSLGQEHAGGGFGGKQAKLGKLIVEVEGLQMLDLIVAANMALWWKVYERIL